MKSKDNKDTINSLNQINLTSNPAELVKIFGHRFNSGWDLLKKRKITKLIFHPSRRVIWIVKGKERQHHILPNAKYCDCEDFLFGIVYGRSLACRHLVAQRLAEVLNDFNMETIDDTQYSFFMEKFRPFESQSYPIDSVSTVTEKTLQDT